MIFLTICLAGCGESKTSYYSCMTNSVNIYYTDPLVKKNVDLMFKNNQDCGDGSYKTAVNCQLIRRLIEKDSLPDCSKVFITSFILDYIRRAKINDDSKESNIVSFN